MRIGVLTGGGDCPGLNAVIRAVVRKGVGVFGHEFVGFRDGWRGPLDNLTMPLGIPDVRGILPRGGTILGSSRTNPFKIDGGVERITDNLHALGVDALIAIGGEDTLGVATKLAERDVHVVGVPKTIDNDLNATDYTFGFDTAVNIAMEAIDRLQKGLDAFGHVRLGGIGEWLAGQIEKTTGKEARTTVLGHIQRGGTPTAFDRMLATRFGLHAIDAVHEQDWGKMVALRGTDIVRVPLTAATSELKVVQPEMYAEAEVFFG
jgi:6-phosphofructokinase